MNNTYRTPELLLLLLNSISEKPQNVATTEDVLTIGKSYLEDIYGNIGEKSLGDTIRWALIHMADDLKWLNRPFGKLDSNNVSERREWLRQNRPTQKTGQNIWQVTQIGMEHLQSTPFYDISEIVEGDLRSQTHENDSFSESGSKRLSSHFERNPKLRTAAVQYHGTKCKICGFDFAAFYGSHGFGFIEIHHIQPVSTLEPNTPVNPIEDMVAVCANCHRMLHRNNQNPLTPAQLKKLIKLQNSRA